MNLRKHAGRRDGLNVGSIASDPPAYSLSSLAPRTEEELFQAARAGDSEALEALIAVFAGAHSLWPRGPLT